jgi:hypothetical protein
MNTRMNEDLAWLRVQDMQREAENRRLMAGPSSSPTMATLRRLAVRTLARFRTRQAADHTGPRASAETRHHA